MATQIQTAVALVTSSENSTALLGSNMMNNTSLQNLSKPYVFNRWQTNDGPETIIVPIIFGIIFIIGLVGNGTLIISVLANKVMRNVPNILIVSLSIGDFLLVLICVPASSMLYTFVNWPYGEAACKLNRFLETVSLGVSVFTLTALSADRYVAIVNPMAKLAGRTRRTTTVIAVSIWIVAIFLAIPDLVFSTVISKEFPNNHTIDVYRACKIHPFDDPISDESMYSKVYYVIHMTTLFILPVLTIGFFYVMMARVLIKSNHCVPTESKTGAVNYARQVAARKKVARVVLSFVIIFIICWLPRFIYLMWYQYDPAFFTQFWYNFKVAGFCLMFMNSCVHPFALYLLSGQFRKYYKRYIFCCCSKYRYTSLEPTLMMHHMHSTAKSTSATNVSEIHSQSVC